MNIDLDSIFYFNSLVNDLKDVKRAILTVSKENRWENDAEHSFDLIAMGLYFIDNYELPLNSLKVVQLCVAHDFVEVFAGDVDAINITPAKKEAQRTAEARALTILENTLNEYSQFIEHIKEYEEQRTEEAKFVKALDRICPMLMEYQSDFKTSFIKNVSWEILEERCTKAIQASDIFAPIANEIFNVCKEKHESLCSTN